MALRLGIVSTAAINQMTLSAAETTNRVEIAAVASRDLRRAEAYCHSHGVARAFGSYDELLADPNIDAVYISLPNSLHVDWSVRALEAGKHVLCEKPLARRPEDAERAFDAAERSERVLMEAFMYRHNPQTARILELVRDGAIGRLRLVRAWFRYPTSEATDIRLDTSLDGGSLMDLGCYCVSISRLLAGEPERAYAEQVVGRTGAEVALYGALRFGDDVVAQLDSSFLVPMRQGLEVVGEDGALRIPSPFRVDLGRPEFELVRGGASETITVPEQNSYALQLENLADAAAGMRAPLVTAEDSIEQARTIARLYEAAEETGPR